MENWVICLILLVLSLTHMQGEEGSTVRANVILTGEHVVHIGHHDSLQMVEIQLFLYLDDKNCSIL